MEENNKILIYTDNDGLTKTDVKLEEDTLWLTQADVRAVSDKQIQCKGSILPHFRRRRTIKRGPSSEIPNNCRRW